MQNDRDYYYNPPYIFLYHWIFPLSDIYTRHSASVQQKHFSLIHQFVKAMKIFGSNGSRSNVSRPSIVLLDFTRSSISKSTFRAFHRLQQRFRQDLLISSTVKRAGNRRVSTVWTPRSKELKAISPALKLVSSSYSFLILFAVLETLYLVQKFYKSIGFEKNCYN